MTFHWCLIVGKLSNVVLGIFNDGPDPVANLGKKGGNGP